MVGAFAVAFVLCLALAVAAVALLAVVLVLALAVAGTLAFYAAFTGVSPTFILVYVTVTVFDGVGRGHAWDEEGDHCQEGKEY